MVLFFIVPERARTHLNADARWASASRRAMEFAVKWMYSVDKELEMPCQDNLQSLMTREEFRAIVGPDIWRRMDYIRMKGNNAAHNTGKLSEAVAMLCLENLHTSWTSWPTAMRKPMRKRSLIPKSYRRLPRRLRLLAMTARDGLPRRLRLLAMTARDGLPRRLRLLAMTWWM